MKITQRAAKLILLVVVSGLLLVLPSARIPYLDSKADAYFSDAMTKASVAYGVCRVVNASVSIIKESSIQMEPAGIGVTLAAGQVLDPLDDLTERASDILITAIVSLGIQKITHELSTAFAPKLIALSLLCIAATIFITDSRANLVKKFTLKVIMFTVIARVCLPASAIVNTHLNNHYFSPEITRVNDSLSINSPEIERLKDFRMPESDGVIETVKSGFDFVKEKASHLRAALQSMSQNMSDIVSNLIRLTYLYVALFMIQVVIIPVGSFWILVRIVNSLCGANIPPIIKHSELARALKSDTEFKEVRTS